jgi:hypothetical protein
MTFEGVKWNKLEPRCSAVLGSVPESVVKSYFYTKTEVRAGAEQLLIQLAAFALAMNIFRQPLFIEYTPSPCIYSREGTLVPALLYTVVQSKFELGLRLYGNCYRHHRTLPVPRQNIA